jgi:hypothetical protein
MFTRSPLVAAALTAAALGLVACGGSSSGSGSSTKPAANNAAAPEVSPPGDIPDNQAYVAYAPPGGGYSVKVPEGWARTSQGGATVFTDKLNSVQMEAQPASAAPTVAQIKSVEVPKLAKTVPGFKLQDVTSVSRKGGRGVRLTYLATSQPDPVTGKVRQTAVERYYFFHDGKLVVLTLSGAKGADNVDPWRIVTDSLRWTP